MKILSRICELENIALATALMIGLTACSGSDETIIDEPTPPTTDTPKIYTMTVTASRMSDDATRALSFGGSEGKTLIAKWTEGDVVTVTKGSGDFVTDYGTLTATNVSADGLTCTLTGGLTTAPSTGDVLTLKYRTDGYGTQKGTLEFIAEKCDYATATVTVINSFPDDNGLLCFHIVTTPASFVNQQAIVKFSLKQPDGTPFAATSLKVKYGQKKYKVTLDNASSDVYVAIPGNIGATVSLEATDGTNVYLYQKSGVEFTNGKYYTISVKMNNGNIDLSKATGNLTLNDGDAAYGTLAGNYKVSIASGAEVTLNGVNILGEDIYDYQWAGLTCIGNATINLLGTNTVRGFNKNCPGIYVPSDKTLTIQGNGLLNASSNGVAAGIGSGLYSGALKTCGNIEIKGGNITATGGVSAAGIGSGSRGTCGIINISGGTITATGGSNAAGIGSGYEGTCGNINISGGTITATGSENGAGIGTGGNGKCGTIEITKKVTRVTAIKGTNSSSCTGPGKNGTSGTVKIGGTGYGKNGVGSNQSDKMTYIYEP